MSKKILVEAQSNVQELEDKITQLKDDNENLVNQLQNVLGRSDSVEHENQRLKCKLEEDFDAGEEMKEMQNQRIARLEHFITEYEKEIEDLNTSKNQLQNQIISLEAANGKLQSESVLNDSLREQIKQLQKDIQGDTNLREELVRNIEKAKASLGEEVSNMEAILRREREMHSKSKERLANLERDNLKLQQELNGLQMRLNEQQEEIIQLEKKRASLHGSKSDNHISERYMSDSNEKVSEQAQTIKEMQILLDEKDRSIETYDDQIGSLKFQVQQKDTEVEEVKRLGRVQAEKNDILVERLKNEEDQMRKELRRMTRNLDELTDERNNYRSQVKTFYFVVYKHYSLKGCICSIGSNYSLSFVMFTKNVLKIRHTQELIQLTRLDMI